MNVHTHTHTTYLFELTHGESEQVDKLLLVLVDAHPGDLRQALQRHVAKHGHVQELRLQNRSGFVTDFLVALQLSTLYV